jgi:hypothetical protein
MLQLKDVGIQIIWQGSTQTLGQTRGFSPNVRVYTIGAARIRYAMLVVG